MANKLTELLAEAKRRRVFRTAGVYLVAVWGISSGGVDVAGVLGIPESILRLTMIAAVAFLPVVVILAWMFDVGRGGVVRDPKDVLREQEAEFELASMPTMIGGDAGVGAVVVRWSDLEGEHAMFYADDFHLGRGTDCRVRFYDPLVSRQHARVFHEDGAWYIEDLGSRNGTHIGNEAIGRRALEEANVVRLNDAGPSLQIDLVRPGEEMQNALSEFPSGHATAHVRSSATETRTATRPVARKT
ncbi:MAG: FHA domain-containing protein [bacterium]|nr:hypothetical protein [Deltaproteobacteria bacterium]MCP4904285.1 FHA domain-containing protein [bacterium]